MFRYAWVFIADHFFTNPVKKMANVPLSYAEKNRLIPMLRSRLFKKRTYVYNGQEFSGPFVLYQILLDHGYHINRNHLVHPLFEAVEVEGRQVKALPLGAMDHGAERAIYNEIVMPSLEGKRSAARKASYSKQQQRRQREEDEFLHQCHQDRLENTIRGNGPYAQLAQEEQNRASGSRYDPGSTSISPSEASDNGPVGKSMYKMAMLLTQATPYAHVAREAMREGGYSPSASSASTLSPASASALSCDSDTHTSPGIISWYNPSTGQSEKRPVHPHTPESGSVRSSKQSSSRSRNSPGSRSSKGSASSASGLSPGIVSRYNPSTGQSEKRPAHPRTPESGSTRSSKQSSKQSSSRPRSSPGSRSSNKSAARSASSRASSTDVTDAEDHPEIYSPTRKLDFSSGSRRR